MEREERQAHAEATVWTRLQELYDDRLSPEEIEELAIAISTVFDPDAAAFRRRDHDDRSQLPHGWNARAVEFIQPAAPPSGSAPSRRFYAMPVILQDILRIRICRRHWFRQPAMISRGNYPAITSKRHSTSGSL